MIVSPSDLSHSDFYSILLNSVAPRPIAWVSTINASGDLNLAPFSFFNAVCVDPPLLAFAPGLRRPKEPDTSYGEAKDTLRNIRETREFVVNIVTYELREAMNLTSGEYEASVNEFELAKVTPQPSKIVRPPRVAESPVNFECKLHQILDFSTAPTSSSLVIGEIVSIHINDAYLKEGRLDRNLLDLIGRMGGLQYTRTTQRFEMVRPKVE
ncbi:MAG TPA: flavin reductase family protein [Candidatus Sulfotelmatobacter sp.]|jgi:flavin reductase (DIM6/NTAB) family NADH-FMN oxidoreductase RutF|nr:flavin reductase family protein [Candidatus Sulfotelmatobacter sp.]